MLGILTIEEIADQLLTRFGVPLGPRQPVGADGTIEIDLSDLDAQYLAYARDALDTWTAVTGIGFRETTSDPDITVRQPAGNLAETSLLEDPTAGTVVRIGTAWLPNNGPDYTFSTFVHELGHALGLSHPGDYNGTARYGYDNDFLNDSLQASIMSYFSPVENPYVDGSDIIPLTPMPADILAMRELYGATFDTRLGDDTYGYGSTAGWIYDSRSLDSFILPGYAYAYTIVDHSGVDTWNLSGDVAAVRIDLAPGRLSSIGGHLNNVAIGPATIIENAHGGAGDDWIGGNAADNLLAGNGGNDTFQATIGRDTIEGGAGEDTIAFVSARGDVQTFSLGGAVYFAKGGAVTRTVSVERAAFADGAFDTAGLSGAFDANLYLASNPDLIPVFGIAPGEGAAHFALSGFDEGRAVASFNEWSYVLANPDLLDAGLSDRASLSAHYVASGHAEGRGFGTFNAWGYLVENNDVRLATGFDERAATRHYVEHGRGEGRSEGPFDPFLYLASNDDLLAVRRWTAGEATEHYLDYGRFEGRSTDTFQAWDYLAENAALRAEVGADAAAAARHYVEGGYVDLAARPIDWSDWDAYLASNPDLALLNAGNGLPIRAAEHFVRFGEAEGRTTTGFDEWVYLASNPDLAATFSDYVANGTAPASGPTPIRHYVEYGVVEGRDTASFDALGYAASNLDLIGPVGLDAGALAYHYLRSGRDEGRVTDAFDPVSYLASHADLMAAFGSDAGLAVRHYLDSGLAEDRAADAFDEWAYLASNLDLLGPASVEPADAALHFVEQGFAAGRPLDGFDAPQYLANYADLAAAYGTDAGAATRHFVAFGFDEGRTDDLLG